LLKDRATQKPAKGCRNSMYHVIWLTITTIVSEILDVEVTSFKCPSKFKVIKSGTNRKLVCDFLLAVTFIVTFAVSRTVYEKMM